MSIFWWFPWPVLGESPGCLGNLAEVFGVWVGRRKETFEFSKWVADQLADAKIGQLSEFLKPEKFGLWLIRIYLRFES